MLFERPLLKLPIRFSAEALEREVRALPASSWVPHPNLIPGNDAVRLVTPGGKDTDDLDGEMEPTRDLLACPNIIRIMSELGGTWGRSRLMGLAAGAEVPAHIDSAYYWRTHLRIHIPVITNPGVIFTCGGESVHMAPGEFWVFDSFRRHEVHNRGDQHRVHLVLDTVGGGRLWDLVEAASREMPAPTETIAPGERDIGSLIFEKVNSPKVMSPWEMDSHFAFLLERTKPHPLLNQVSSRLKQLRFEWGGLWACYGDSDEGVPHYRALIVAAGRDLGAIGGNGIVLENGVAFYHVLGRMVLSIAVAPEPAQKSGSGDVMQRRLG